MSTTGHNTRDHAICEIAYAREAITNLRTDLNCLLMDAASEEARNLLRLQNLWAKVLLDTLAIIEVEVLRVALQPAMQRGGGPIT